MSQAAEAGREEAFQAEYETHRLPVYRTIRAIVLDAATAEDLTQETFERAYRSFMNGLEVESMGAWLHRIAVNLAISHQRRQKLARLLPIRLFLGHSSGEFDQAEARSVVERALAELSPKLRAAVVLHYYQGMTRDEMARVLGVPPGTAASRLGAAMQALRLALRDQTSEPKPDRITLLQQ